jgi:hypothetical protein
MGSWLVVVGLCECDVKRWARIEWRKSRERTSPCVCVSQNRAGRRLMLRRVHEGAHHSVTKMPQHWGRGAWHLRDVVLISRI